MPDRGMEEMDACQSLPHHDIAKIIGIAGGLQRASYNISFGKLNIVAEDNIICIIQMYEVQCRAHTKWWELVVLIGPHHD